MVAKTVSSINSEKSGFQVGADSETDGSDSQIIANESAMDSFFDILSPVVVTQAFISNISKIMDDTDDLQDLWSFLEQDLLIHFCEEIQ